MEKVLILASVASMIEQFNIPNIKLLIDMGYEVHVACNFEKGNTCTIEKINELKKTFKQLEITYFQVDFIRDIKRVIQNIKAYKQVYQLLKQNGYKFIHCHSPIGSVCGRIAAHKINTKVVYTAHGFHFYKGAPYINWIIYYPIEKWLSKYTDILITINKEDEKRAKEKFNARNVCYIPGVGVSVDKYINNVVDVTNKRKEIGLTDGDFVILSVGEVNKNKNHEVVIRSLSKIKKNNIHYIVCGKGILEKRLKELAEKLGLSSNVHLLGFRTDVDEIYKISDMFIFPSYREGLSVALMEAIASGLPVVASNIRGNTDLLEHRSNGLLVNKNNVKGYVEAILEIYVNENNLYKTNNDIAKYDIKNIKEKMKDIYLQLSN